MPNLTPWVVETSHFSRSGTVETHSVYCVQASELAKPYGERERIREVVVSAEVADVIETGEPCPAGPIRNEW